MKIEFEKNDINNEEISTFILVSRLRHNLHLLKIYLSHEEDEKKKKEFKKLMASCKNILNWYGVIDFSLTGDDYED